MMHNVRFYLPNRLKVERLRVLNSSHGLSELFDRMEAKTPFAVPQNSLVINLDNITFGPDRYAIVSSQSDDHFFKVIYYSLLYYIFEREYDEEARKAYERLMGYILTRQINTEFLPVELTSEEAKVFLVKFLNLLASARNTRKVVLEELNNLPQIDHIFIELIKQISGHRSLKFEENARAIEKNLQQVLGVSFDLLSCELFLIGEEFQIQMRHYERVCEFSLLKDSYENILRIKEEFFMGESAYFIEKEEEEQLCGDLEGRLKKKKTKASVVKKSTIKSIEWDEEEVPSQEDHARQADFGLSNQSVLTIGTGKELKNSEIRTDGQSQERSEKPKVLNFHQIMLGCEDSMRASTVRSNTANERRYAGMKQLDAKKRFHKQSFQTTPQSPFFHKSSLGLSFSVKCIKSDAFEEARQKNRASKRVPTFIVNRAKAKQQKKNPEAKSIPKLIQCDSSKQLRITFSYRQ